jgi:hypothetical protein
MIIRRLLGAALTPFAALSSARRLDLGILGRGMIIFEYPPRSLVRPEPSGRGMTKRLYSDDYVVLHNLQKLSLYFFYPPTQKDIFEDVTIQFLS